MSLLSQPNQWGDNNACHTKLYVLVLNTKHFIGYLLSHHPIIIEDLPNLYWLLFYETRNQWVSQLVIEHFVGRKIPLCSEYAILYYMYFS